MSRAVRSIGTFTFPALREPCSGKPHLVPINDAIRWRFGVKTSRERRDATAQPVTNPRR